MDTADQIVERAFTRVNEITNEYPSARGPLYRQIGYRQRKLFAEAAKLNPERFGVCATAPLVTSMADLSDIVSPVPTPELIQRIEILDPGTSGYNAGDDVSVVRADDIGSELPPRAMLRDRVIIGVQQDLANVNSVRIYYPRLPDLFAETDGGKEIEFEAPWDYLLVLHIALYTIGQAAQLTADIRKAAYDWFQMEEKNLEADFFAHVSNYGPLVSRFQPPRVEGPQGV